MSSSSPIRLVFMSSDAIALPTLDCLLEEKEHVCIQAIYTQPDRARGRGKKVKPNAIKSWAFELGIPVFQPDGFDDEAGSVLAGIKPDILLVMAYGHLLPQAVIDTPAIGIYNIHTSLLPQLRGASPIETAVASGMEESGVSLMQLVLKMDAGPVCDQAPVVIAAQETGGSYREKLAAVSPVLLKRNLQAMVDGSLQAAAQDEEAVSYCRLLVKQDGQLNFSQPAKSLAHRINGLNPWPGCVAELEGVKLKVGLAAWSEEACTQDPGVVVRCGGEGVDVATGEGVLRLLFLQKPGGTMLAVDNFLRGYSLKPCDRFVSREMHELVSRKPVSHKRVFQLYQKP